MGVIDPTPRVNLRDTCPCGSGRQYRRCCWPAERRGAAAARTAIGEITSFAVNWAAERFPDEGSEAAIAFFDRLESRWEREDARALMESEHGHMLRWVAGELFVADVEVEGRRTPLDVLLDDPEIAPTLTPPVRAYVESWRQRAMSLYEVEDVSPGEWVEVRDLLSRTRIRVLERTASQTLRQWMALFARVVEVDGTSLFTGSLLAVHRSSLGWMLDMLRGFKDEVSPSVTWQRFLKREWAVVPALYLESIRPRMPELRTTDGQELVMITVRWPLLGPEAGAETRRRLDDAGWIESGNEDQWVVAEHRSKDASDTVLTAGLRLEDGALVADLLSREREEQLVPRIEALLEGLLGDREREEALPADVWKRSRVAEEPEPAEAEDPVPPEIIAGVIDAHYRKWVDEPVPALDGLTPRDAARRADRREDVRRMLKDIEAIARDRYSSWDPSWMWEELGLTRR